MKFTDIFIRRPIFSMALSLIMVAIGVISFTKMTVRQYPEMDSSVVTVTTNYPGATAELMSGFVTTPIENAVGSIDGIDYMTSTNIAGQSTITVNLQLGYPMEKGITDVSNAVSSVRWALPPDIQDPVIAKTDPSSSPILYIAFLSESMSPEAITDYLLRVIQPQLQSLNGVSQAAILGSREYAMRINLDTRHMAALGVTANDVMKTLSAQNLQAAPGRIEGAFQEFNITASTQLASPEQFNNLVVKNKDGSLVRLRDVGNAYLGAKSYRNSAVIDGTETIVIGIITTSDANPLAVSKAVQAALPSLQDKMPPELKATVTYDSSLFISASIEEVWSAMAEASIFVILVIFLFLGSVRAVIIPILTIPLSLIGVCGIMLMLGFSINTLTLLAWVIAIGLVVDDAIVVLENIHRHMEDGLNPIPAAIIGTREIAMAVIAMTITLAVVYAPIGFTGGLTGILFTEFAFTLAAAVLVSGFIALTLSPMMTSRIFTADSMHSKFAHAIDVTFTKLVKKYKKILTRTLDFRWFVVAFAIASYALLGYLMTHTPQELAPDEDQGVVLTYISGPSSSNIKFTEKYTDMMKPIFAKVPEMQHYGIINGFPSNVNSAISFLSLEPWDERDRTAMEINTALFPSLWAIPGLKVIPFNPEPLPASGGALPVQFVLKSPEGLSQLVPAMKSLLEAVHKNPGFQGIDTDLKFDKPQIDVEINRDQAGDLGVPMKDIAGILNVMFAEPLNILYSMGGRSYYVIPELKENFQYQGNPNYINELYVRSESGALVPMSNLVKVSETVVPQSLNHFAQLPSATLFANLTPDYAIGDALKFLDDFMAENHPEIQLDTAGQARQFLESMGAMTQVLIIAVVLIFLVLAAQFESFRDPFIILFVVPLTLCGAILTLTIAGKFGLSPDTLSIYSKIGLTTLVGLIAKHGILIVEFANQLQEKGHNPTQAVIESASMRLRPILMTTGAMVLGVMPLALASGAGAESRHQIGWVIAGGMTIGTCFSLFIVPVFYSLMSKAKHYDAALEQEIAEAVENDRLEKEKEAEAYRQRSQQ